VVLLAWGCDGWAVPSATQADPDSTTVPSAPVTTADHPDRLLEGFRRAEAEVGDQTWLVAVADTPDLRARGLMGVADLGDLDGMLFVWPEDVTSGFWMKNTLIPLDVAFFGADGSLVDVLTMVPCEADPCPSYRPSGAYRWALEAPAGRLAGWGDGDPTLGAVDGR
jgi:uncharacterized membrane protein (UPF0127 family)